MNLHDAVVNLLINFAYMDNNIDQSEIEKIKEFTSEFKITDDEINKMIKFVTEGDPNQEAVYFKEALVLLDMELDNDEKSELFRKVIELICVDGKIIPAEVHKAELLAKQFKIDLKDYLL